MWPRERQLARLLRALIACCALLFAFEAPSLGAGSARDTSGWVAERVTTALLTRVAVRASQTSRRTARQASAPPPTFALAVPLRASRSAPAARRTLFDARHRYLELRTLLC